MSGHIFRFPYVVCHKDRIYSILLDHFHNESEGYQARIQRFILTLRDVALCLAGRGGVCDLAESPYCALIPPERIPDSRKIPSYLEYH